LAIPFAPVINGLYAEVERKRIKCTFARFSSAACDLKIGKMLSGKQKDAEHTMNRYFHNMNAVLQRDNFGDQFFHSSLPGGCSPPGSRTVFDEMNYG
jgi:hypothetical protein